MDEAIGGARSEDIGHHRSPRSCISRSLWRCPDHWSFQRTASPIAASGDNRTDGRKLLRYEAQYGTSCRKPEAVVDVAGYREETTELLKLTIDLIFFRTRTGKVVARAAAENLTPVIPELGGLSPVLVNHQ